MMNELKKKPDRLTITLGNGQRRALEIIAERNHTNLAFIIRYALDHIIKEHGHIQLPLDLD